MLDNQDRVALINKSFQHGEQPGDILEMQSSRGLVEHVQGMPRRSATELGGQLDSLRLASGKLRGRLAESHIAKADIHQSLEMAAN